MTERELVEEYFIENRTKVLDIAAFLDRLDRAREMDAEDDFRVVAFRKALQALCIHEGPRVQTIQMILSDPNTDLLEQLDRKSAFGAYGGNSQEVR